MLSRLSILWLCFFIPSGITGYTLDDLAKNLENLESKLMSENEELRARVAALERLVSNCDCTEKQPIQIKEPNEYPVQEMNYLLKQKRSNGKAYEMNQKRIGNFPHLIPYQLSLVTKCTLRENIRLLKNQNNVLKRKEH